MGVDFTGLDAIFVSLKYLNLYSNQIMNALTLGRQGIHINQNTINYFCKKYNFDLIDTNFEKYSEILFNKLGFSHVDSIDCSKYEGATIIHDMNKPLNITKKYHYIFDGGTIEHIFNIPQVLENVIDLLEIGGIFCSVTVNNNYSGHGMYQFSPELFLSTLTTDYGMEIKELYLSKTNTEHNQWINVNDFKHNEGGRNDFTFNDTNPVYIITIAKKISNERKSLILDSPQQYSYKNIDWIK